MDKMYRKEDENEDLKNELQNMKRQLATLRNENQSLKVKVRKMEDELSKKNKHIEAMMDPQKSSNFRKIVSESGATMMLNLKNDNDRLSKALIEKDGVIKKLQSDLNLIKLYAAKNGRKQGNQNTVLPHSKTTTDLKSNRDEQGYLSEYMHYKQDNKSVNEMCNSSNTSLTGNPLPQSNNFDKLNDTLKQIQNINNDSMAQYQHLSHHQLLNVIHSLKSSHSVTASPKLCRSPMSDLERIELLRETPHEEIQQLYKHFMEMLTQVDKLRTSITEMKTDQIKTECVLKKKDDNIEKLVREVKRIKRKSANNDKLIEEIRNLRQTYNKMHNNKTNLLSKSFAGVENNEKRPIKSANKNHKSEADKDSVNKDDEDDLNIRSKSKKNINENKNQNLVVYLKKPKPSGTTIVYTKQPKKNNKVTGKIQKKKKETNQKETNQNVPLNERGDCENILIEYV